MTADLVEHSGLKIFHVRATDKHIRVREDLFEIVNQANEADCIAIEAHCLDSDFFNLSTGVAGELLQMAANFRLCLGVIGTPSSNETGSFGSFMRECSHGRDVIFAPDINALSERLAASQMSTRWVNR